MPPVGIDTIYSPTHFIKRCLHLDSLISRKAEGTLRQRTIKCRTLSKKTMSVIVQQRRADNQRAKDLSFETEPTGYEKTVLSELQGAWQALRDEVAAQAGFRVVASTTSHR